MLTMIPEIGWPKPNHETSRRSECLPRRYLNRAVLETMFAQAVANVETLIPYSIREPRSIALDHKLWKGK